MDRQSAKRMLDKKLRALRAAGGLGGYRYLRNGDIVGEMCPRCGDDMLIRKGKKWEIYCRCGHEEVFHARDPDFDPPWSHVDSPRAMSAAWYAPRQPRDG